MNQAELSKRLDTTPGNVNRWAKGDGVPSYELCVKLLRLGMTVEELFGVDYKPQQPSAGQPSPEFLNAHPELMEGVQEQLMADIMAGLKEKGIFSEEKIRDIARQEIERLLPSAKPINKF